MIFNENELENVEVTEQTMQDALQGLISWGDSGEIDFENASVRTYEDAGVMTYNKGLVISMPDGSEFQITIVQSR